MSTGLPQWAVIGIGIVCAFTLVCVTLCICKKCFCKKRKKKKDQKLKTQIDMQSVKDLGQQMKDKVQPDIEDLDGPRVDDKKKEDLGRLQFSLGKNKKYS